MNRAIPSALCLVLWPAILNSQLAPAAPTRWWRDPPVQRSLGLTATQVGRLETIFNRDLRRRIALNESIRGLEVELARAMSNADKKTALRLIEDVENLRRDQNTRRSVMLLEMYMALTPPQRAKFFARWARPH